MVAKPIIVMTAGRKKLKSHRKQGRGAAGGVPHGKSRPEIVQTIKASTCCQEPNQRSLLKSNNYTDGTMEDPVDLLRSICRCSWLY